jgi:hypothetical protein
MGMIQNSLIIEKDILDILMCGKPFAGCLSMGKNLGKIGSCLKPRKTGLCSYAPRILHKFIESAVCKIVHESRGIILQALSGVPKEVLNIAWKR